MDLAKEYKKDLKIYKKNLKTAQAIIDLVKIYNDKKKNTSEYLDDYMSIIVEGLDDSNVRIKYKGTIEDIIDTLRTIRKEMAFKYRKLENKKRVLFNENIITKNLESGRYNLMEIINEYSLVSPWNTKLIVSHAPVEERAEMFYDYAVNNKFNHPEQPIFCTQVEHAFPDEECPMERVEELRTYLTNNPDVFDRLFRDLSSVELQNMSYELGVYFTTPERVRYLLDNKELDSHYSYVLSIMMNYPEYSKEVTREEKLIDLNDFIDRIDGYSLNSIYRLIIKDIDKETLMHYAKAIGAHYNEESISRDLIIEDVTKKILNRPCNSEDEYIENVSIAKKFIDTILECKPKDNKTLGYTK